MDQISFVLKQLATYASASTLGSTETNDLSFLFLRKTTVPSTRANNVWSLPIPTFYPG